MKSLLDTFQSKPPAIVFEWNDNQTEAKGWLVINSLRGGAAGGGTRMRLGLDRNEVESLAKTMEIKFTVSGPPIGGAKSGICFDPNDPRKTGVIERWYRAVIPLLKYYYGTGGDLNMDEIDEVIPITQDYGLWHPQEGVVNGYFKASGQMKIHKLEQLRLGVSKVVENPQYTPDYQQEFTVADLITGYGVAESVKHYYHFWGGNIRKKRALIQGWGNVASAAGYYLAKMGVKIVGIMDRTGGIVNPAGLSFEHILDLYLKKKKGLLYADKKGPKALNETFWDIESEIFIPAAASRLISKSQVEKLSKHKLEVIACGANVPFDDEQIFFGETMSFIDKKVAVIPDFIANCGMARVFAYLMQGEEVVTDKAIFDDTSQTIKVALEKLHEANPEKVNLSWKAMELALEQVL